MLMILAGSILVPATVDAFLIGLTADHQNCTNEGQEVFVGIIANDPCFTCMCKDGHVQCRKETCPSTDNCYMILREKTNKCCHVCKGCDYQGKHYANGDEWTDPQDPCRVLTCEGGVISITRPSCQVALQCDQPLPPRHGECCPRCKGCQFQGKQVNEGQRVTSSDDPCVECTCRLGGLVCSKRICPVLTCPPSKMVLKPGHCCPVCTGTRKMYEVKGRCLIGKKQHANGASFRVDSCTNCTCQSGTGVCQRRDCRKSSTSPSNAISRALPQTAIRQSLPTALPASRPLTCSYRSVLYQDGAKWTLDACTACSCNEGEVRCSVQQCPVHRPKHAGKMAGGGGGAALGRNKKNSKKNSKKSSKKSPFSPGSVSSSSGTNPAEFNQVQQQQEQDAVPEASSPCPPGQHPVKEPGQCCPKCIEDDAVCTVFGDPHYRTFDGRVFNFQGACKYLLTSDCKNNSFSVRVTNDARTSRSFSWTKTVTLKIEDLKVTLGQNMKVKVNHKRVSLPFVSLGTLSIVQEGYSVVVRTNLGVKLLWDGESFLEVTVPPVFKNRLCGLCGNFNGRRRDDLRMKSGQMAKSINQFGNSWKVGGAKSCSRIDPPSTALAPVASKGVTKGATLAPLCQRQWEVRIRAVRECNVLRSATFATCHAKVSPVRFFKSCLLDMCECPSGKQCYCEALTAYAHDCLRHGITIDPKWRQVTSCIGHAPASLHTLHHSSNSSSTYP